MLPDIKVCHEKGYVLVQVPEDYSPETDESYKLIRRIKYGNEEKVLLDSFLLAAGGEAGIVYYDYLCLPGEIYEYAFQLIDSSEIAWKSAQPLEESIILSDSEHTLYIKYNPKMSSFKSTILEQKIDTIGSKYPFFFRNGNVNYKEMPIAGLISYQADEFGAFDERFAAAAINDFGSRPSVLKDRPDDYYLERIYKREVEKWLTNGQPKLLRTLTEGAFIVRLMNVSLSPEDRLGRRIHSFQATAYEIAEANEANLEKYNLMEDKI